MTSDHITFKPKGHKKVTVTPSSSFELKKCKFRKPTNKHKYDYIITVNSVDYKLYAKTYKRIMRQLTQFNSNYTSKEFSQANDSLYSSIYVTDNQELKQCIGMVDNPLILAF